MENILHLIMRLISLFIISHIVILKFYTQSSKILSFNDKLGIFGAEINEITRDPKGNYWIATENNGLSYTDLIEVKNFNISNGLKTNDVLKVKPFKGKVLIASFDAGLAIINGYNKIERIIAIPEINSNSLYDIGIRSNRIELACKGGGVNILDTNLSSKQEITLIGEQVLRIFQFQGKSIYGTSKNGFWIEGKVRIDSANSYFTFAQYGSYLLAGTTKGGLKIYDCHFKPVKFEIDKQISSGDEFITKIEILGKYIALSGAKFHILQIDTSSWKIRPMLTEDIKPRSIYQDYNRLLIGTRGNGAKEVLLYPFVNQNVPYSKNEEQGVSHISFNDESIIAINEKTHVYKSENSIYKKVHTNVDYTINDMLSLNGCLLFTTTKGFESTENSIAKSLNSILLSKGFKDIEVNKIVSINGVFYASSNGNGLFKFSGNNFKQYTSDDSLVSNSIYKMHTDANGNLFCGYSSQGLTILNNKGVFKHYNKSNGFLSNSLECFTNFRNGLLIGTNDTGIIYFDGGKFTSLFSKDARLKKEVKAIAVDGNTIWLATASGLYKIFITPDFEISYIKDYTYFLEANKLVISSDGLKFSPHHELYMATNKGLFRYELDFDFLNTEQPRIILDEVNLFNKSVNWRDYNQDIDSTSNVPIKLNLSHELNSLSFKFHAVTLDDTKYSYKLIGDEFNSEWSDYTFQEDLTYSLLAPGNYILLIRSLNSSNIENKNLLVYKFSIRPPFYRTWWFLLLCFSGIIGSLVFYFRWRSKELERINKDLETAVKLRTEELSESNTKLSHSLSDIRDSINYAKKLQDSILPSRFEIKKLFPQSFLLFKPRDVVSGDFYWASLLEVKEQKYLFAAAADCTGHGVPGAFMSMMGSDKLNSIVNEKREIEVDVILNQLNRAVKQAMKQDGVEAQTRDGMDISIVRIDYKDENQMLIHYAGANRPLWILRNGGSKVDEIKADKVAIGGFTDNDYQFTKHELSLNKKDRLYMFSDGFPDQFGGEQSKKFMSKKLREVLQVNPHLPMEANGQFLDRIFMNWKGKEEQVDDVLVFGIEL